MTSSALANVYGLAFQYAAGGGVGPGLFDREEYARTAPGRKVYAQRRPAPEATDWNSAKIDGRESTVVPGQYRFTGLGFQESYEVYIQTGEDPDPSDTPFWEFLGPQGSVPLVEGSGSLVLTVTVKDAVTQLGVPLSVVSILATPYSSATDSFGAVMFGLNGARYTIRVRPPAGYLAPEDQIIDLETDATLQFQLEATSDPAPGRGWVG